MHFQCTKDGLQSPVTVQEKNFSYPAPSLLFRPLTTWVQPLSTLVHLLQPLALPLSCLAQSIITWVQPISTRIHPLLTWAQSVSTQVHLLLTWAKPSFQQLSTRVQPLLLPHQSPLQTLFPKRMVNCSRSLWHVLRNLFVTFVAKTIPLKIL